MDDIIAGAPASSYAEEEASGFDSMEHLREMREARSDRKAQRYLIHPNAAWLASWDMFTALTLLFIAVFTPFEVAFLPASTSSSDSFFILGRAIDAIFVLDMVLQFFIMIYDQVETDKLITDRGVIAQNYLHGWFMLDSLSIAASFFDILPIILSGGSRDGDDQTKVFTALRVVRILRLIKLLRLLKASTLLKAWFVKIPTPRATVTILSSLVECGYVSHIFACVLGLMTIASVSPLDTWLATHGYCRPQTDNVTGTPLIDNKGYRLHECAPEGTIYVQCIWWSAGMLMGAPISSTALQGPYERHFSGKGPVLLRLGEQLIVLSLKIITAFFWTSVIARFVQVYNNLDPDSRDFRMGWDALNRFVSYFRVPKADALELRRYYIERADEARAKSRKQVMNNFSPYLAEKVLHHSPHTSNLGFHLLVRLPTPLRG